MSNMEVFLADKKPRWRIMTGVGPPPAHSGPPKKWNYLPLETIGPGDFIEITMDKDEAKRVVNAIRSYAGRVGRKFDCKYSVRITDFGIGIWRVE